MKNRVIAMAFAALLSLGVVACEGGTATDDGGTTDPGADALPTDTLDDGALEGGAEGGAGTTDDAATDG